MKLTTFSLLSLCMVYVHGCEVNNIAEDGCSDLFGYIAKITCLENECTCHNPDDDLVDCTTITTEDIGALVPADLNGEKCEKICLASTECIYFRWEKDGIDSVKSHCTLLDIDQCDAFLECKRGICVSGQAGCHSGDGPEPPVPDSAKCSAGVTFVRGSVHWSCSSEKVPINIYGPDAVPTGTVCKTAHKCELFNKGNTDHPGNSYANDLVVECNPAKSQELPYVWGKADQSLYDVDEALVSEGAALIDLGCEVYPADLSLEADKLNEPGVSLVCDTAFTANTNPVIVKAPNVCVLLCNFHHAFSFESELAEDGTGVWNKYAVGSNVGVELKPEEVNCWDFMNM